MRRPVPLAVVLLLAVSLLAACTSHGTTSQVQSQGQASSVGPPPTAALPAGEQATVHVATVPDASGPSNELLWGDEKQVGPAYDFTVAKEPSSALIAFSVDPSKLPASVGVPDATPAGLYIQAFEPSLGSWIPLRSSYDTKTRAVTATAPHLSTFSLAWTAIKCAVTCPAALFAKVVKRFTADVVANVKEAWSPRQEDDECASEADTNWAVRSSISKLSGCVIDGSPPVMQEENPLLLPMRVRQPQGAPHAALAQQPYMADGHPELTSLVAGIIDWAANATLLAPRGYGVVPLTALPSPGHRRC